MAPRDLLAESGERFAADVAEHQLTVLHDDGLYRHLRFQRPNTGIHYFDLVTWPGTLAIRGDLEGYMFTRVTDMFEFFRAASGWNMNRINPQYWAQKLDAQASPVRQYSEEKCRQVIAEYVDDAQPEHHADVYRWSGLRKAVQRRILNPELDLLGDEATARKVLGDFVHGRPPKDEEVRARLANGQYRAAHLLDTRFRFSDIWEMDLADWDFHFLRACHAIQWGIEQYDRRPVAAPVAVA